MLSKLNYGIKLGKTNKTNLKSIKKDRYEAKKLELNYHFDF